MKNSKYSLDEFEKVFKDMDTNKGKVGIELLSEARFLKNTLDRLKNEIENSNVVGKMQQGNYTIDRSNPALVTYNATITNYQKIIKQITDLLPKEEVRDEFDEFDNF